MVHRHYEATRFSAPFIATCLFGLLTVDRRVNVSRAFRPFGAHLWLCRDHKRQNRRICENNDSFTPIIAQT